MLILENHQSASRASTASTLLRTYVTDAQALHRSDCTISNFSYNYAAQFHHKVKCLNVQFFVWSTLIESGALNVHYRTFFRVLTFRNKTTIKSAIHGKLPATMQRSTA